MDSKSIGQCCICGGLTEKAWDKCGNEMKFLICSRAECRWRAWSMVRRAAGKKATEYVFDGELAYSKSGRRTQQDVLREHYDDIKKEYAHGMTRHEIAKRYSVSLSAVNTFFRKHDIYVERRGRKRRQAG